MAFVDDLGNGNQLSPDIRAAFGESNPRSSVGPMPKWNQKTEIGVHKPYRTQELRVSTVEKDGDASIILETIELGDGQETLKCWLWLHLGMIPGVLAGLIEAEKRLADLEGCPPTEWPDLPLHCGDGKAGREEILIMLSAYKGRLEAKLSTSIAGGSARNGRWAKLNPQDIQPVGRLILQAYDQARSTATNAATPNSANEYDDCF